MRHYSCYFLIGDVINATENIGAKDDAGALLNAEQLLASSSFASIEVWQENRLVGRLSAASDPVVTDEREVPDSSPKLDR